MDERIGVPVITLPDAIAQRAARRGRTRWSRSPRPRTGEAHPRTLAPFSSWGLGFDGSVKPELLAPGVGLATVEPGTAPSGESAFGAVSGSSAAAAVAAGAAALLAQARPDADAETLHALLVGGSDPLGDVPVAAQGSGLLDLGRAAAAELVADPPALTFGRGTGDGWQGHRVIRLRNVSSRRLTVFVDAGQHHQPARPALARRRGASSSSRARARSSRCARVCSPPSAPRPRRER